MCDIITKDFSPLVTLTASTIVRKSRGRSLAGELTYIGVTVTTTRENGPDNRRKGPREAGTSGGRGPRSGTSVAKANLPQHRDAEAVSALLDIPEIRGLIADLEATRWTGRPGYPVRAMVGMGLVKALYVMPTWTRIVRLVADHAVYSGPGRLPRRLTRAIASPASSGRTRAPDRVHRRRARIAGRREPRHGRRRCDRRVGPPGLCQRAAEVTAGTQDASDPDAAWGHRSAVSTRTRRFLRLQGPRRRGRGDGASRRLGGPPGQGRRIPEVPGLLDKAARGASPPVAILDKGYDQPPVYDACQERDPSDNPPARDTAK